METGRPEIPIGDRIYLGLREVLTEENTDKVAEEVANWVADKVVKWRILASLARWFVRRRLDQELPEGALDLIRMILEKCGFPVSSDRQLDLRNPFRAPAS